MTETSSHDELRDQLAEVALETLEGEELQRVLLHTRECPECARRLDEYREVVSRLAMQLPARSMNPDRSSALRARLVGRTLRGAAHPGFSSRRPAFIQWTGWLVAAGIAGVLLIHHAVHRPLDYGWLVAGALLVALASLATYVRTQRRRATVLEERLRALEQQGTLRDDELEP